MFPHMRTCPILLADVQGLSAVGVVGFPSAGAQAQVGDVAEGMVRGSRVRVGGVRESRDLRAFRLGHLVARVHDGLPQATDPLLLAEGVIGLQAVRLNLGAPSAAHAEAVPHWDNKREAMRELFAAAAAAAWIYW